MEIKMIAISLPDGNKLDFDKPVSGLEVAASIGAGLAKAALAIEVDGNLQDLSTVINADTKIAIITGKDDKGLEILRHSCAHVMAEAVKELYPEVQVTIGPSIENGFYYDFARKKPFTPEDLEKIEKRMQEIVKRDEKIEREVWNRDDAIKFFEEKGEKYKAELIHDLPQDETITLYRQGDFVDLCRGVHVPSTGKVGSHFKLMKLAGAYWRGDSKNEMLQRIYGTCWNDKKALKAHLNMLEEAEKRDHRRLGKEMDLFRFYDEAPGAAFWLPKGLIIFNKIIEYMRHRHDEADYVEIKTPELLDRSLWETSGHWEKFREHMFTCEDNDRSFAVKHMNCPGGMLVYNRNIVSYRDLPMRVAEFGRCHRNEASGALHGLMRVKAFTMDDAHVFCTEDQMLDECCSVINLILDVYKDFGFENIRIKFSDRPEKRIGTDETWDKLEASLLGAVEHMGLDYTLNKGEGAFYGPKLEFVLRDAIGRDWQCGTLQVDLNLPERFKSTYIGEDGEKHQPVMLHRALLGSLERFIGILIEHYVGRFPLWLAPVQVVVATITSDADDYGREIYSILRKAGIRTNLDIRNEKINYKIREHSHAKIPQIFVVGKREEEEKTVAIRHLGGKSQEILALDEAIAKLK